mgnify:CR=1 FL=1
MKGRGRDKRGPPDEEDTTASRQNAHGRVALVATGTPADTAHGRVALVATGKGYGRDKRGPPKRGPPKRGPPARGRIFGIICKILDHNRNTFTMPREAKT